MELQGDGPDTALARLLHATQRLEFEALQRCLTLVRASDESLARVLVGEGLLEESELDPYLSRLEGDEGAARELRVGEVVAERYRIGALLGQGGMGAVYRATELETGREVAVKFLLPHMADDLDIQRFEAEGQIGAHLGQQSGFVPVHAAGLHRGLPFLAMGLIRGPDLEAVIDGLSQPDLARVVERVARTLQTCHDAGVVHRDLKPANILIGEDGLPVVADLGLARAKRQETLTQTGEILGTPAYMAPEQLLDARSVDGRSDVYALGAILYRGLAGRPPFSGPLITVLDQVLSTTPPRPSSLRSEASGDLERVCLRAMAKRPQERYPDALSLAEDLARVASGTAPVPPRRSTRLFLIATALGVVGVALALAWGAQSQATPSPAVTVSPRGDAPAGHRSALRSAFVAAARGERFRALLEPVDAVGASLDALKADAFHDAYADCARALATGPDQDLRFRKLSGLLGTPASPRSAGRPLRSRPRPGATS